MTTVWIGWEQATFERNLRPGVSFLLTQEGAAAWAAGCSPRNRLGRSDEDIMANGAVNAAVTIRKSFGVRRSDQRV